MGKFNHNKAVKLIEKYPVVSFDIFDTLVKRNVSQPPQIFDVVERRYNLSCPDGCIQGFRKARVEAERKAREDHRERETTLDEIYDRLSFLLPSQTSGSIACLKELEIESEIKYCEPNIPIREIYNKCLTMGKRVIIISDMYLPKAVIEQMLKKCGIENYEKLFLSSEVGEQKRTGKLYDYVIADMGVAPSDILHFGDRKKADNLIPRIKGMGSYYVEPVGLHTAFLTEMDIRCAQTPLFPFVNNKLMTLADRSEFYRWGYEALGPLLLGFVTWVHRQAAEKNIGRVFFLARDMHLVIQIYRKLYGTAGTAYLEVSRASLRREYVLQKGTLGAIFDTMGRRKYTARQLLASLQLEGAEEICRAGGISADETFVPGADIKGQFPAFDGGVMQALKAQENNILRYLQEKGLLQDTACALVDIGWHGTIQNMLEVISHRRFEGLYFGNTKRENFPDMHSLGYWFSEKETDALPYLSMITILEVMLFNQVGTVLGYTKKGEGTVPLYGGCENNDFSAIEDFQNGALAFADDYSRFEKPDGLIPMEEATTAYKRLAFHPTLHQARLFSALLYEDGKMSSLADARPLGQYLLHPAGLVRDYRSALWKEGFIKQVLPFVNDPYKVDMAIKQRHRNS